MSRELLQRAKQLIEHYGMQLDSTTGSNHFDLLRDINEYLARSLPKPVPGVAIHFGHPALVKIGTENNYDGRLYTSAPEQKPLSDDEIVKIALDTDIFFFTDKKQVIAISKAIERAHGITDPEQSKPQSNAI